MANSVTVESVGGGQKTVMQVPARALVVVAVIPPKDGPTTYSAGVPGLMLQVSEDDYDKLSTAVGS